MRVLLLLLVLMTPLAIGCADADKRGDDTGSEADSGIDSAILGAWERALIVEEEEEEEEEEVHILWTGLPDGSCTIMITNEEPMTCAFSAAGGDFGITDSGCEGENEDEVGDYTYVIAGTSLTFSLVSDACEDRAFGLSGEWTRVE
jgi:hypothetical protein